LAVILYNDTCAIGTLNPVVDAPAVIEESTNFAPAGEMTETSPR
jgi:hypothetical protein